MPRPEEATVFNRLLPLALVVALAGCQNMSTADVAQRVIKGGIVAAQGFFISDADEIQLGQQTTAKVLAQMPENPNPELRDYVNRIGQAMVAQSDRTNIAYQFRVIDSNEINAFAAPGGFIFVTTGALRLMTNEAQLAGVIGHEVGHVAKRHTVESVRKAMIAQGVATAVLDGNNNKLMEMGANIAANLILKGFDRNAELESDRLGASYAYRAGYDPRALGSFLDALRQKSGDTPAWLVATSEHPRTDDRLTKLSDYMADEKMVLTSLKTGEAEYKAAVTHMLGAWPPPPPRRAPTTGATTAPAPTPTPEWRPADQI
jgi:predicted Zn-dependent protease